MDFATALVLLALLILTASFIARPLIAGSGRTVGEAERRLSSLYAQQDQILSFLGELDMDFTMGKILPEDYQGQRAEWLSRGAAVLKEIDGLRMPPVGRGPSSDLEARLEQRVASLRQTPVAPGADPQLEARLEREVARLRDTLEASSGFCGHCGSPLVAGDRFCSRCGAAVPVAGTPA